MEILEELERWIKKIEDAQAHRNFQIQDLYYTLQLPTQQEEPTDLEKVQKTWFKSKIMLPNLSIG